MNSCFNIQRATNQLSQSDINRPEIPETTSRNAFLRLTDCGKARFVLPESLFRVVIKPLQHCRKGFSVMRESLFHDTAKPFL